MAHTETIHHNITALNPPPMNHVMPTSRGTAAEIVMKNIETNSRINRELVPGLNKILDTMRWELLFEVMLAQSAANAQAEIKAMATSARRSIAQRVRYHRNQLVAEHKLWLYNKTYGYQQARNVWANSLFRAAMMAPTRIARELAAQPFSPLAHNIVIDMKHQLKRRTEWHQSTK